MGLSVCTQPALSWTVVHGSGDGAHHAADWRAVHDRAAYDFSHAPHPGRRRFLSAKLGSPYRAYLQSVPRIIPRLWNTVAHGTAKPYWMRAVLAEILPIGVFITLAFFSWSYDNRLMGRAILISFGVSLVARVFLPRTRE